MVDLVVVVEVDVEAVEAEAEDGVVDADSRMTIRKWDWSCGVRKLNCSNVGLRSAASRNGHEGKPWPT